LRLLERLVELERDVRYQDPPEEGEAQVGLVRGEIPVLLSAPHAAVHTRRGRAKEEEEFTAAMARLVAELTGAHALYARRRSATGPNWYPDVPISGCWPGSRNGGTLERCTLHVARYTLKVAG